MGASQGEIFDRLESIIGKAGYAGEFDEKQVHLRKVGYSNKSVDMSISLLDVYGESLVEFESKIADPTDFEHAALAVYEGNFRCRVVSFSAIEIPAGQTSLFQIVARSHLYADYFSDEEFLAMLKIFMKELDEIDDEVVKIAQDGLRYDR
jgi:hypothetical protein